MCFYEDSMHVCMNIFVCVYVRVINTDAVSPFLIVLNVYRGTSVIAGDPNAYTSFTNDKIKF